MRYRLELMILDVGLECKDGPLALMDNMHANRQFIAELEEAAALGRAKIH